MQSVSAIPGLSFYSHLNPVAWIPQVVSTAQKNYVQESHLYLAMCILNDHTLYFHFRALCVCVQYEATDQQQYCIHITSSSTTTTYLCDITLQVYYLVIQQCTYMQVFVINDCLIQGIPLYNVGYTLNDTYQVIYVLHKVINC